MSNQRIDPATAADLDTRLWEWARKRAYQDKDLSAALDVLRHYAINSFMLPMHQQAADSILRGGRPAQQPAPAAADPAPKAPAQPPAPTNSGNPADILRALSAAGMLRGRNGQKAMSLLEQANRWSSAQFKFAVDLSRNIRDASLVYVALRDLAEDGAGGDFAESLVASFDEWGSYTERQMEAARNLVERETGEDPLSGGAESKDQMLMFDQKRAEPAGRPAAPPPARPAAPGPRDDDDIPF